MKTAPYFVLLLLVGLLTYACDDNSDYYVDDDYSAKYTSKQIETNLKNYIDKNETLQLDTFFKEWNSSVKPNSKTYVNQNDTTKSIYSLFKAMYDPFNLNKLGTSEWGDDLYKNSKYIVVQNNISYGLVYSATPHFPKEDERCAKGQIKNFRPELSVDSKKVLYLTPEYDEGLRTLLNSELPWANANGTSSNPNGNYKYADAIRKYFPLIMGHWGNFWNLETHPMIRMIVFNQDMTKAIVDFRIVFEGGEATFDKDVMTGKWTLKESHITWIE